MDLDGDSAFAGGPVSRKDHAGAKLVLEHVYELVRRVGSESLFTTFEAIAQPFARKVWVRYYTELEDLGLPSEVYGRLCEQIARGGDGDLAVDHGEIEGGAPLLVLQPPPERSLRDWWLAEPRGATDLARLGLALVELVEGLGEPRRSTVTLDRVYIEDGSHERPRLCFYGIGARPTRAEVRRMSGLVRRDLVLGFPPECFAPANADDEATETTPAADVYRVGAILYELVTARHPTFPDGKDVAAAAAELVSEVGQRPKPAKSGSWQLDALIAKAIALDPGERPAIGALREGFGSMADALTEQPASSEGDSEVAVAARPSWRPGWLASAFRYVVAILALAVVSLGTFLATNSPPENVAVLVTSEPEGVRFDRVLSDGSSESLGRTPFILEQQALDEPFRIRPVYEDGQIGAIQTVTPSHLEVYDACRGLQVRFLRD